jgi:TetR/AcrR family transcriptional repressor of nem operon
MAKKLGVSRDVILDVAQGLLQTRGYNGFSYKDIAQAVGIRTASLHYHYPSKADLGTALAARYRSRFKDELQGIAATWGTARQRLERYAGLYGATLRNGNRLCLCGMLGAEMATLPEAIRNEVTGFFRDNEAWLDDVVAAGREAGELRSMEAPADQARLFLAVLEGAMIVARGTGEASCFDAAVAAFLEQIAAT